MNKTRLLAVALLAGTLALTGCRRGRGGGSDSNTSGSGDPTSGQPTSQDPGQQGFDPNWISEGYTYSATFPIDQIKAFIGSGSYEVKAPSSLEGGCYYLQSPASGNTVANFQVIVDGTQADSYLSDRLQDNWIKYYETSAGYGFIDPTEKYEVDVNLEGYDDEFNPAAPTSLTYYLVSDLWDTSYTATTDTAWSDKAKEGLVGDAWKSYSQGIPFFRLGTNYMMESVDNSSWRAWGIDLPDYVAVYDSSLDNSLLTGYDVVLTGHDFVLDETSGLYNKEFDYFTMQIGYYWGEYGNEIDAYKILTKFDAFPSELLGLWAQSFIQSKASIPNYVASSTGVEYTFDYLDMALSEESESLSPVAEITVSKATSDEYLNYAIAWENAGATVTMYDETDLSYAHFEATLGKNCAYVSFEDPGDGSDASLTMDFYADDGADETKHIKITNESAVMGLSGTLQITYESFDVDKSKVKFLSSDTDVATISATGLVTPAALGTSTITVFEDADSDGEVDTDEVSDTLEITVSNQVTIEFTLSSASEVTKDGVTVAFAKGEGASAPAWYSNGLRLYAKNTVTITSTGNITAISFNWQVQGTKEFASCTANVGSYSHPSTAGVGSWTGSANSVTFTLGAAGQLLLNTFSVTVG